MSTFKREVTYKSRILQGGKHVTVSVTKEVTFNDLDETETSQHKLHFKIMSIYRTRVLSDSDGTKVQEIDTDILYDLTVMVIKNLVVYDDNFKEVDCKEFLGCSLSILKFGLWFLNEHIIPFIEGYASL